MSTQYTTEPPPTATVLLQTTAGPLTLSIFATQTPLASRNFLQHVLDGTYTNNIFHRIAPGFVIQTGDPTGTGAGGTSIYEDREFERYDALWARELGREVGEKIVYGDEVHSRLKFNRRGLVGMAKGDGDGYGSQFFITLGDCRRELDGTCTMIGRVEGEGIYNVVKIAEGELAEGSERPVFPERITGAEVLEVPKGEAWRAIKKRERAVTQTDADEERPKKMAKREKKKKGGKALLSFGDEEGEDAVVVRPKKAKFNTALIDGGDEEVKDQGGRNGSLPKPTSAPPARQKEKSSPPKPQAKEVGKASSPAASRSPETSHRRKPSFHDSATQLPLRDPEVPSRSLSPTPDPDSKPSTAASLNAEIAALKASMRRDNAPAPEPKKKKSALEQMIPATSTKGRKRPRPGDASSGLKGDATTMRLLNAFKARLEGAAEKMDADVPDANPRPSKANGHPVAGTGVAAGGGGDGDDDDEAVLCDLHFIANCQSCSRWDAQLQNGEEGRVEEDDDTGWMGHALSFEKDRLGKDLTWRKKNEEELVVIDPREKEREIKREIKEKRKGRA